MGNEARMEQFKNAYRILTEKPEGMRPYSQNLFFS